jgi:hypothetical protein
MPIYHKIILILLSLLSTPLYANEHELFTDFSSIIESFEEGNNRLKEKTNLAGKQRMLTQRITKLALLIDSNIKSKKNIKKLQKETKLYSQNLITLQSDNDKSTKQLQIITNLWRPFKKNIENVIQKKKGIEYITQHNEELLNASNKLVSIYETSNLNLNYLDKAKLHIVNLAGRQRMLLEKMSKEKILLFKKDNTYKNKLKTSISEFDSALKKLRSGDSTKHIPKVSNPKLIKKLNIIEPLWKKLKPLYIKEDLNQKELLTLIRQSSLLLLESNIYVKLTELETEY